jgi:hypothetical protein
MRSDSLITTAYTDVAGLSGSVGLIVDRTVHDEQTIGTAWLVDENTVATCAHVVVLYADFLTGLKVHFPGSGKSYQITGVTFHPRFDQAVALEMAQRSLSAPVPALALQDYNIALLTIAPDLSDLERSAATAFNKRLSLAPLPRLSGLAGAVEEIGLALVIQTVSNARKDGILFISDERNRPIARLFWRDGKIKYAKFGKLSNESAVYQMFQSNVLGQFFFKSQDSPDWSVAAQMDRTTEGLLLEAHRRMDEVAVLAQKLGGPMTAYRQVGELLRKDPISADNITFAERLWPFLDGGVSVDQLWEVVNLDNYTIYSTLVELLGTEQVQAVPEEPYKAGKMKALEMAAYEPLSPWDEIVSLSAHPTTGRAQMRRGSLVGLLRPNDPYHILHSLNLPYRSAGSPMFKNGKVVGIHCGMLPLDPALHALPHHLHQMLWIDAVQSCFNAKQKKSLVQKKSVGLIRPEAQKVGKKTCPKCQALMVKEAVFCGTCGSKM